MHKLKVLDQIRRVGVLPVLRAKSAEEAVALANAIEAGGVSVLEVTMTVPGAVEVIRRMVAETGDRMLIGAGTVLDAETARACMLAGAQFIVSPAFHLETVRMCRRYNIAVMPGALTPTEVVSAWEAGADVVKVFPCNAMGGASYLKALKGPLPEIELIPTGGVTLATAHEFLEAGAFAIGVGGDLVDTKAIRDGKPEIVTENAKKYLEIVRKARSESA